MSLSSAVRGALARGPEDVAPDTREAEFVFTEDFAGFDGHFPGDPMLPGIAQIMAVALTVQPGGTAHTGGTARLRQIRRTKFVSMVRPGDAMRVRAQYRAIDEGLLVTAECATENGVCAQIKVVLENA